MQLQQGDVNIIKPDKLPEFSEWSKPVKIETGVVRKGTATGHSHRIVGDEFTLFRQDMRLFAKIISDDCRVVHEEHKSIELKPGKYEFVETVEYDHFREESRRVVD